MVRPNSLPKPTLSVLAFMTLLVIGVGCARKGDPIPKARLAPRSCQIRLSDLRTLDVTLPTEDSAGGRLIAVESVRVYYLPMGVSKPSGQDVITRGEILLEKHRHDLPDPGKSFKLSLKDMDKPTGWIAVCALRVGQVMGEPSESLPWLHPAF